VHSSINQPLEILCFNEAAQEVRSSVIEINIKSCQLTWGPISWNNKRKAITYLNVKCMNGECRVMLASLLALLFADRISFPFSSQPVFALFVLFSRRVSMSPSFLTQSCVGQTCFTTLIGAGGMENRNTSPIKANYQASGSAHAAFEPS
jgi:hypothetical protein